jgi:hypothetical protein
MASPPSPLLLRVLATKIQQTVYATMIDRLCNRILFGTACNSHESYVVRFVKDYSAKAPNHSWLCDQMHDALPTVWATITEDWKSLVMKAVFDFEAQANLRSDEQRQVYQYEQAVRNQPPPPMPILNFCAFDPYELADGEAYELAKTEFITNTVDEWHSRRKSNSIPYEWHRQRKSNSIP